MSQQTAIDPTSFSSTHLDALLIPIGTRLSKIAQVFSGNGQLKIKFNGNSCYTDNTGVIVLPSNCDKLQDEDMELVWSKLNHETGHCRVQKWAEHQRALGKRAAVNKPLAALAKATPHSSHLAISSYHASLTAVELLQSLPAFDKSYQMWFNVIEDVRMEREESERYTGIKRHLAHGVKFAHTQWAKKLTADPYAVDAMTQVGIAIILNASGLSTPWICPEAKAALAVLSPLVSLLDSSVQSIWDAFNLSLVIHDAVYTGTPPEGAEEG